MTTVIIVTVKVTVNVIVKVIATVIVKRTRISVGRTPQKQAEAGAAKEIPQLIADHR